MVRRLPCDAPVPSGSAATMRPRPVMMPVNMAWIVSGQRARDEAQVGVDALDAHEAQLDAVVQRRERPEGGELAADAEQLRRHVHEELVDEPFAHQRAVELVPRLDV